MATHDVARTYKPREILGSFWTFANILSLARLVLVGPIVYIILTDGPRLWLLGLVLLAVATDFFDGRVARWSHTVSEWGKVLDPLADKIGAALVMLALVLNGDLPAWLLLFMVVRDVLIVWGGIRLSNKTGHVFMSMWSGKIAITAVALTMLMALLQADPPVMQVCIWTTAALLLYSFIRYVGRYLRVVHTGYIPPDAVPLPMNDPRQERTATPAPLPDPP
ncbi:MAG: CDP-alcohol phosphatidyltransferase family protein [Bacteroidetes bacterium]|nr:CDP-alcohol phosphatidyltransferase [Rhodothermaceae bacterium RA]RMH58152.1 MAG: CDP-alcohol phosphatidyltransferase family protein [Bacteroidota bacterium]